jgi:thiamine biosynthesis lipoprotein
VVGEKTPKKETAVRKAFAEMSRMEGLFSEWLPDSDISRINAAAGSAPVRVREEVIEVIEAGLTVSRWSQGAFDLTWAALRGLYNFEPGSERYPTPAEIEKRLAFIDYKGIVVDVEARTVMLRRSGMRLGAGGIVKGLALDKASRALKQAGIKDFMMLGGGQVIVSGKRGVRPWRVGIRHPRRPDYYAVVEATSGSVSTSGDYERAFVKNGRRWHHLIDPRSGYPADGSVSVTVLSQSGLYADAMSTALFVSGAERATQMLDTAPERAEVVVVGPDLELFFSPGLRDRLYLRKPLRDGRLALMNSD